MKLDTRHVDKNPNATSSDFLFKNSNMTQHKVVSRYSDLALKKLVKSHKNKNPNATSESTFLVN